ncbi:MAG: ACT domain-containing protein [Candidatus Heimdallarchaeota archaeon]
MKFSLLVGKTRLAIFQLSPDATLPNFEDLSPFWSITKTENEISIIIKEEELDSNLKAERGWRYLKVNGPLEFNLYGILVSIANPLANQKISIFAISTFNTDYILIKEEDLDKAISVLRGEGFVVTKE